MAAMVEVVLAEILHQLEVVQAVGQRHGLLEADICAAMGGVACTQGWWGGEGAGRQGRDKAEFMFKKGEENGKLTYFSLQHSCSLL